MPRREAAPASASASASSPAVEEFVYVSADDPLAAPLLEELALEYDTRYGTLFGGPASVELNRYPTADFASPRGAFVLLLDDGRPVAGGAFKTFDTTTSELKRIWTSRAERRRGLARRVVAELEDESRRRGFGEVYLTTGPRQPEARQLYLTAGYTPLFDVDLAPEEVGIHGFGKSLTGAPLDVADLARRHGDALADFSAANPSVVVGALPDRTARA